MAHCTWYHTNGLVRRSTIPEQVVCVECGETLNEKQIARIHPSEWRVSEDNSTIEEYDKAREYKLTDRR